VFGKTGKDQPLGTIKERLAVSTPSTAWSACALGSLAVAR
jgi:hypothetical protein